MAEMICICGESGSLQEAITYLRNEWNAVVDIFNYGDTYLDNNMVERMNR